jgi:hypothetical protein
VQLERVVRLVVAVTGAVLAGGRPQIDGVEA